MLSEEQIIELAVKSGATIVASTICVNGIDARDFCEPFARAIEAAARAEQREELAAKFERNARVAREEDDSSDADVFDWVVAQIRAGGEPHAVQLAEFIEAAKQAAQALQADGFYGPYAMGVQVWEQFEAAYNAITSEGK